MIKILQVIPLRPILVSLMKHEGKSSLRLGLNNLQSYHNLQPINYRRLDESAFVQFLIHQKYGSTNQAMFLLKRMKTFCLSLRLPGDKCIIINYIKHFTLCLQIILNSIFDKICGLQKSLPENLGADSSMAGTHSNSESTSFGKSRFIERVSRIKLY